MKRTLVGIAVLLSVTTLCAQEDTVAVKIRAILVDKDLNPKPVPKLLINLQSIDPSSQAQPSSVTTGFDGLVETRLPLGRYHLTTPRAVEFQGKKYSWDLVWEMARPETHLDLSVDNAKALRSSQWWQAHLTVSESSSNVQRTAWSRCGANLGTAQVFSATRPESF